MREKIKNKGGIMMSIVIGNLKINVEATRTPGEAKLIRRLRKAGSVFFAKRPIKGAMRVASWEDSFMGILRKGCMTKETVLPLLGAEVPSGFPVRYTPVDCIFYSNFENEYQMKTVHGEYIATDRDLVVVPGYGVYHPNMFSKDGLNEKLELPDHRG